MSGHGPLAVAVVGLGAMGRHHARIASQSPGTRLVAACDERADRARAEAQARSCEAVTDAARLPESVEAVIVATPTSSHRAVAEPLLRRGISCLVEKPIAGTLEDADALIAAATASGARLMVGHSERFNPAVIRAGEALRDPLFVEGHRLGVFPERSLDVDVVLDLMIHDLDLLLWLTGGRLISVDAAGVAVLTPRIDIAHARLVFDTGCTANVTCSRVSAEIVRKLRVFREDGYCSLDLKARSVERTWLDAAGGRPEIRRETLAASAEDAEPLASELAAFVAAVRDGREPEPSGRAGRAALAAALQVLDALAEHRARTGALRAARPRPS